MLTIIESLTVSEAIDAEREHFPRLDDALDALKWWLAHEPESGEIIDDLNWLYKQAGDLDRNIPSLVTIYTFTKVHVELKFILVRLPCA